MEDAIVISGSGYYAPPEIISNEELVVSFNAYVEQYNQQHILAITAGEVKPLVGSSAEFIAKASGIHRRHVIDKKNILDINIMKPQIAWRPDQAMSFQCEFALPAAQQALSAAGKQAADIDAVIVSCATTQRSYPAIAIELQQALGIQGYAFDMQVACSSATFALQNAYNAIKAGNAKSILVVIPEIATPQVNFRQRDSHFIFGDAAVAVVIEKSTTCQVAHPFKIMSTRLFTQFSTMIRNNQSYFNRVEINDPNQEEKLFKQQGKTVFKEVVPMAAKFMLEHLQAHHLAPQNLTRLWLHQANSNMNQLIAQKMLGHSPSEAMLPMILAEYANTGSVGALLNFHFNHADLQPNCLGILCSFGAGYSIGSLILQRL